MRGLSRPALIGELTRRARRLPLRMRLTLVFAGVMAVVLAALGLFLYFHSEGHGWPSGHASSTVALYGALLLIALASGRPASPPARASLIAAVIRLLALIGVSRVVLGVHYPTDVIGGLLLAGPWLAALGRYLGPPAAPRPRAPVRP